MVVWPQGLAPGLGGHCPHESPAVVAWEDRLKQGFCSTARQRCLCGCYCHSWPRVLCFPHCNRSMEVRDVGHPGSLGGLHMSEVLCTPSPTHPTPQPHKPSPVPLSLHTVYPHPILPYILCPHT